MARTLPWLKNASITTSHSSNHHPSKRQRTHSPSSDTETRPRLTTEKQKQIPLRSVRTPSTSPPPQPPPPSPLRPGLHADDIYIMVEDEFLATARAFTAHLHHAEYLRLKNAAKARSETAGIGIERPVDGVTTMRAETRKRKEAEVREKKVRGAVDSIVVPGQGDAKEEERSDASDEFFEEGEKHDDPWQGTQLQHFMTKSPKKAGMRVGLTGLQGVVSHTRAAAGFQKWEKKKDGRAGSPTATRTRGGDSREEEKEDDGDDDDEDTDDLDTPTYPHHHHHPPSTTRPTSSLTKTKTISKPSKPVKHPPPPPPKPILKSKPPPRAFLDITPLHNSKPPLKLPQAPHTQQVRKQEQEAGLVKFESVDRDRNGGEHVSHGIRERAEVRRRRRERGREGGREGVGDEIPVFLV